MSKGVKIILLCVLLAIVGIVAYFFLNPKKALSIILPDVNDVRHVHIKLTEDTARVDLDLDVKNRSPFKIHIDSLSYHVQLDTGIQINKSQFINLDLPRGSRDSLHLPLDLPFKRIIARIKSLQGKQDSVTVPVSVRAVYSTVFGKAVLNYSKDLRLEVPIPPDFKIVKVELVDHHQNEFNLKAHIKMINYGKLELNVSDLNYTMEVKDLFIAKGHKPGTISIKPKSVITKTLPIKVEVKKLFKAMRIYIKNEKVHYHLTVKGFIQNDKLSEERTPVEIESDGDMRLKK